jgi:hypothetical protein
MGKRELFIALGFIIVGCVVYQLTAPARKPGEEGFSFSRFWTNAHRSMGANRAQTSFTQTGTIAVSPHLSEVRIDAVRSVRVVGEARSDMTYEMAVTSSGPDQDSALKFAKDTKLKQDDMGGVLTLRAIYPGGGRQSANLVLRVPSRLAVRIVGGSVSNGVEATGLAALHLENVSGDSEVSDISGALGGSHRNGSLKVHRIGSVKMTLQNSRATFDDIQQGLTLDLRDGECRIQASKGPIELDERRAEVQILNHNGPIRVGGNDGRVNLDSPRGESRVDVHSAEVEVRLTQAIPLSLLTSDDTLRILLDGPPHVVIDAVASQGKIQATDFGLQPESVDQEARLTHEFGGGGPRVSLRNLRGNIVIRNSRAEIEIKKSK